MEPAAPRLALDYGPLNVDSVALSPVRAQQILVDFVPTQSEMASRSVGLFLPSRGVG